MFSALEKIGVATVGTMAATMAAYKTGMLPGFFMASNPDESQQRVNSFAAGVITGGIVTGLVFAIWKR